MNICRTYRYAAYRQFTMWIYGHLGRHIRQVVPSCVVSFIRQFYPEPSGVYTGFSEADVINI